MRILALLFFTSVFILGSCTQKAEQEHDEHEHESQVAADSDESPKPAPKSPRTASMAMIGSNHVHIDYSAPSVRGRTVWGGLVSYDQVWVTGAHSATNINFDKNLMINGTKIAKGKYALFTIPGRVSWTVVLNKNWNQHLTDEYDQGEDVLRFDVKPEDLEENVEQLTFSVESTGELKGQISIAWEKVRIAFDIESVE